jgi:hypothetical protein
VADDYLGVRSFPDFFSGAHKQNCKKTIFVFILKNGLSYLKQPGYEESTPGIETCGLIVPGPRSFLVEPSFVCRTERHA